jgi:hypothetical protein
MGQRAFAEKYGKRDRQTWGQLGGRPHKLDDKALMRLRQMLEEGKTQGECAQALRVSLRTIGRIVSNKAHFRPFRVVRRRTGRAER